MTPTETVVLATYFFILLVLAGYGWHRYYLVYAYMKYKDRVPVPAEFPDRVLWGTDWPHPNLTDHMPDDGLLVDHVPHVAVTADQRQKLLVDNPLRLYWPDERP